MTLVNRRAEVEAFLRHLLLEKRYSQHTVNHYRRDLMRFVTFLHSQGDVQWPAVTSHTIRQWMVSLHQQGLSGRSISRHLSAVRSLYRYLIRHQLASQNPAQAVQAPKSEKRLPATLDVDQMLALLDNTPQDTFLACRDRAMMELFYSSGLRLAELAGLNQQDIDWGGHSVRVTGKGNKQREVPIGQQAMRVLQHWLDQREQAGLWQDEALFVTQKGRRIGMRAIQKRLQLWGKKQGISERVHPHRLRHAFASHLLESSGDLRSVQELLGHEDITTTQIYTHLDFQHLAQVYDQAHPRAKKK